MIENGQQNTNIVLLPYYCYVCVHIGVLCAGRLAGLYLNVLHFG